MMAAVILAGGAGQRMGGVCKADVILAGRPLLARVIERMQSQAAPLLLSVAEPDAHWQRWGLPVIVDGTAQSREAGPVAGIVAALEWLVQRDQDVAGVVSVPCDTPWLPSDLVARLTAGDGQKVRIAWSAGQRHPIIGFWPRAALAHLRAGLDGPAGRRLGAVAAALGAEMVEFPALPVDPFTNINRPDDVQAAEIRIMQGGIGT